MSRIIRGQSSFHFALMNFSSSARGGLDTKCPPMAGGQGIKSKLCALFNGKNLAQNPKIYSTFPPFGGQAFCPQKRS